MSLRDLAAGESCAAGPSTSALSAVADAILPTASSSLPFASASASASSSSAPTIPATENAVLTGHIPPELLAASQNHHVLAPPRSGAATDLFERAFADAPPPPATVNYPAPHFHPLPPPPPPHLQKHAPFAAAFRDAAQPRFPHPPQPSPDDLVQQFSTFHVSPAHGKAPVLAPHYPPPPMGMGLARPYMSRYAPPAMSYARNFPPPTMQHMHPQPHFQQPQPQPQPQQKQQAAPSSVEKSDSQSWGDEFTSLEGPTTFAYPYGREAEIDDLNFASQFRMNDSFEDMYEAAFRDYLRPPGETEKYKFAEREGEQRHTRSAIDALEEGVRLRESGKLAMAVRAFEEALNRDPEDPHPPLQLEQKAKAWYLLGLTLAETDDDAAAIVALQQGLQGYSSTSLGEQRQDNPYLLSSLIALAVSYTNEQLQPQAFGHIKEWFHLWCKEHGVGDEELSRASESTSNGTDFDDAFQDAGKAGAQSMLQRMKIACARAPKNADIRVVMGVLHNLHREYSKAAETLRHAVMLRPNDPGLWNKLGATLANGGESDDALRAYRRSVDINPALVRAWVNVGTAYSNRGEFPKAARYYLKSVAMAEEEATSAHNTGLKSHEDRMAHVWGYLRTTVISMSRPDLLNLVDARDIQGLRSHFSF